MKVEKAKIGSVGLIQEQPDGRIVQIGLTEEQSTMLNILVAKMSESKPLMKLGEDYEMILNWKHKEVLEQRNELINLLKESALQIEHMHNIFKQTGTGNSILSRVEDFLDRIN